MTAVNWEQRQHGKTGSWIHSDWGSVILALDCLTLISFTWERHKLFSCLSSCYVLLKPAPKTSPNTPCSLYNSLTGIPMKFLSLGCLNTVSIFFFPCFPFLLHSHPSPHSCILKTPTPHAIPTSCLLHLCLNFQAALVWHIRVPLRS